MFAVKQKLTVFQMNSLAMTIMHQLEVTRILPDSRVIVKLKGKRKEFNMPAPEDTTLVFDGWDVPFKADSTDGPMIRGNACVNLVGDPEIVKMYIDTKNLNDKFTTKDRVLICVGDKEFPLYPETPSTHPVVQRVRKNSLQVTV